MKRLRILSLALLLFCPLGNFAQNIPFVADTTSGCDTLHVTFRFINLPGTDTISTLDWDFGNGQTAEGKTDHEVFYDSPGIYDVSITINGNTTRTRFSCISIYPTPDPYFTFRDYRDSLVAGSYTYLFSNVDQSDNTLDYSYVWDLGSGSNPTAKSVLFTFPEAGLYSVDLLVRHTMGCSARMSRIIEVRDTLILPNVFSPNDDNINDYFKVITNGLTIFSIRIFSSSSVSRRRRLARSADGPTPSSCA